MYTELEYKEYFNERIMNYLYTRWASLHVHLIYHLTSVRAYISPRQHQKLGSLVTLSFGHQKTSEKNVVPRNGLTTTCVPVTSVRSFGEWTVT